MNKTFYQAFYPDGIYIIPEKKINVEISEVKAVEKVIVKEPEISYLGENKKKILILLSEPGTEVINDRDKEFLGKILGAIKLSYSDVALLNAVHYPKLSTKKLESSIAYTKVILFGDGLNSIFDSKIVKYRFSGFQDLEVLYSDSLYEIQEDKNKKVKLWEELKKMFP